jgi:integrase
MTSLFPSTRGTFRYDNSTLSRWCKARAAMSGRFVEIACLESGQFSEVQKLLGHSSANVTQIYSHLQPDQMHDTVNRLAVTLN